MESTFFIFTTKQKRIFLLVNKFITIDEYIEFDDFEIVSFFKTVKLCKKIDNIKISDIRNYVDILDDADADEIHLCKQKINMFTDKQKLELRKFLNIIIKKYPGYEKSKIYLESLTQLALTQ